jgi:hypothetical protein
VALWLRRTGSVDEGILGKQNLIAPKHGNLNVARIIVNGHDHHVKGPILPPTCKFRYKLAIRKT